MAQKRAVRIDRITGDDRMPRSEGIIQGRINSGWELVWFQEIPDGAGEQQVGATIMIFKSAEE